MEERGFNYAGFNEYLSEHKLMASRCSQCGSIFFPPRPICSQCFSTSMEWFELSGMGNLAGFTSIYVGLPRMNTDGYSREKPYCVGVIRLAEGPAFSGQIFGVDCAHPEDIKIGTPVHAVFLEGDKGSGAAVTLAFETVRE